MLANYLNGLNHRRGRGGVDVEVELELLRCLKRSLGNKVGITHVLASVRAHLGRWERSTRFKSLKSCLPSPARLYRPTWLAARSRERSSSSFATGTSRIPTESAFDWSSAALKSSSSN